MSPVVEASLFSALLRVEFLNYHYIIYSLSQFVAMAAIIKRYGN